MMMMMMMMMGRVLSGCLKQHGSPVQQKVTI